MGKRDVPMNVWLDQRPAWQLAALWAISEFLLIALSATIMQQFVRPFLSFGYVTGYAGAVSLATAIAGTWARRRRLRRRSRVR